MAVSHLPAVEMKMYGRGVSVCTAKVLLHFGSCGPSVSFSPENQQFVGKEAALVGWQNQQSNIHCKEEGVCTVFSFPRYLFVTLVRDMNGDQ